PGQRRAELPASAHPRRRIPSRVRLGSAVDRSKPSEWEETITTSVRDDLAELVKMLGRASSGLRLQRLEWRVAEWDDYFQLEFLPTAVVSTYVPPPTALYDQTKLETLVRRPVVFGGVTYQMVWPWRRGGRSHDEAFGVQVDVERVVVVRHTEDFALVGTEGLFDVVQVNIDVGDGV
ncbi:uncharacterized protein BXZ73DRAFT_84009, partial [Epithele typhae]|uniref:uncharacterized protein n=1 Tax=Epithele typhae TaxID=378194 RepID=UPI0020077E3C